MGAQVNLNHNPQGYCALVDVEQYGLRADIVRGSGAYKPLSQVVYAC